MQGAVMNYEKQLSELVSSSARFVAFLSLARRLPRAVVALLDLFGAFYTELSTLHEECALRRCALEIRAQAVEKSVRETTTIL
eukprot:4114001-Alexandrium_andersonii.AAC.1